MIKFEHAEVWGFEHAIRGMRNPMNSWERSDTTYGLGEDYLADMEIGQNDYNLMASLIRGGQPHRKFLRQIFVSVDITAPLYWWKEFDTYKVGTTANSCSTMHKIHAKEFTIEDFSTEHLLLNALKFIAKTVDELNYWRDVYLKAKSMDNPEPTAKDIWWQMIQLLPSSYNQKRTITMTYENLLNMYEYRRGHKLDEWRQFCDWIFTLPQSYILREGVRE
jgi:hypothetical protein